MSALARLPATLFPPAPHVAMDKGPAGLAAIADPGINLAVWQRHLSPALVAEAGLLAKSAPADVRVTAATGHVASALTAVMADAGWPALPALVGDIAELAALAATSMATSALDIRLEIVTSDACRKFHADYVPLRLISTYAGPGSQWLSNDDAAALASGVAIEQLDVRALLAGEVALFKGRLRSESPIIHRSPPIAGTGQRRLVLVINSTQEGCC
jgi:hypothetical protein